MALLPTWAWLAVFVAIPAGLLAVLSVAVDADGVPPFALAMSPDNLLTALGDPFYRAGLFASLRVAAISAALCLLLGFPLALAIARTEVRWRSLLLMGVMLPFWTGFLLRIAAWIGLLRDDGWINAALLAVGLISAPLHLLYTDGAMYAGIVYAYLPFMVLPLVARLTRLDPSLEQAAADLGASPWRSVLHVTLPLALPGVWAGLALVFVPVTGEYVIPELLGGPQSQTLGRMIADEFFANHDWPLASALSLVLLALLLAPALAARGRAA
ncbi:MAG: ABC transporter permease [Acidisphaera sp.]|nr:ABC transporter permease [Acidisphaera sp.]MBV9812308.1 ABC transporter permease [Acetobacteraceae bacterium]